MKWWALAWRSLGCPHEHLLWHTPNGGSRRKIEACILKGQGVRPGVPDLFLAVPRGGFHGLFVEMKRRDGGVVSEAQSGMASLLQAQGYKVRVCFGFDQARAEIEHYMQNPSLHVAR